MGYWYNIHEGEAEILPSKVEAARNALFAIDDRFTDADESLPEMLTRARFRSYITDDGGVVIYGGESKYRYAMRLVPALAPFMAEGARLVWVGEDNMDFVRQTVVDGQMVEEQGRVVFG